MGNAKLFISQTNIMQTDYCDNTIKIHHFVEEREEIYNFKKGNNE